MLLQFRPHHGAIFYLGGRQRSLRWKLKLLLPLTTLVGKEEEEEEEGAEEGDAEGDAETGD